ncbi:Rrf2 family transcriptional regulator [Pelagibacterium sp. 26DY04]|uniref:Rrf2 family transcriptional regulator n=1 Tax=Pelagibacterium sp. 26DY04 TaxID=2967130 RepID=UPI0028163B75|nr:Rrf2 family transcriptional regulator [Pelagibacterium sp. 26DY04]WMT88202.1 Rrf2 family transcriptional regulator [Pelagibacterium sp. 26DY04]
MRLSTQTNFAVRTLVYCAVSGNELNRVGDMARAFGISDMFLFKIIVPLTRNGLLETVRGRRGGVRLARPAPAINLLEVIRLTEDGFALSECFTHDREKCPFKDRCAYTNALDRALEAFQSVLAEYTIADLAGNPDLESALNIIALPQGQRRAR